MADANVDSVQQSQDAQNLDNLTSLQQADSTAQQPAGATADATVTTTNPPAPDTPSLYNEVTGTQNNQADLEAAGTNSLLDTTTFTNDGREGTANESPTVGSGGTFGTEVNTGDSQVQYTVTNENPIIQGSGTNGTQNTVGGTQGVIAAEGSTTTEAAATTEAVPTATTTDSPTTNSTPEPIVNPDGTTLTDPTVDPLVTDQAPQEPVVIPVVSIAATDDVAVEGVDNAIVFTVSQTVVSAVDTTVLVKGTLGTTEVADIASITYTNADGNVVVLDTPAAIESFFTTGVTVEIVAGQTNAPAITFAVVDDVLYEQSEGFGVTISAPTNATLGTATASATIDDEDATTDTPANDKQGDKPVVSIAATDDVAVEGVDNAIVFTVSQTVVSAVDTTVLVKGTLGTTEVADIASITYTNADGNVVVLDTPAAIESFFTTGVTVEIVAGQTNAPAITFAVVDDVLYEQSEGFGVTISAPTNATLGTATASATIDDEDATTDTPANDKQGDKPVVSIAATDDVAVEGVDNAIVFTVSQTVVSAVDTTVLVKGTLGTTEVADIASITYTNADGNVVVLDTPAAIESFFTTGVTVEIVAGQTNAPAITFAVVDDVLYEQSEGFGVTISAPTNATLGTATASATIDDEDATTDTPANDKQGDKPVVSIAATDDVAVEGVDNAIVFTVSQTVVSAVDTTVLVKGTLGTTEVADIASITYTNADGNVVVLDTPAAIESFFTTGVTVEIVAGQTNAPAITFAVVDDVLYEQSEGFGVTISAPTNATLGTATASATIDDEDATTDTPANDKQGDKPVVSIAATDDVAVEGVDNAIVFTVSQTVVSAVDTTVLVKGTLGTTEVADIASITYTNADGNVVVLDTPAAIESFFTTGVTVEIVAGQTNAPAITFAVVDDVLYEQSEGFGVTISAPTNATLGTATASATIDDEDATTDTPANDKQGDKPVVSIAATDDVAVEGVDNAIVFTVSQTVVSAVDTTVLVKGTLGTTEVADIASITYTNADGNVVVLDTPAAIESFFTTGVTVEIVAGQTNAPAITFAVVDDVLYEQSEGFGVTISAPTNATLGTATASATIDDEDATTDTPANDKQGDKPVVSIAATDDVAVEGVDNAIVFTVSQTVVSAVDTTVLVKGTLGTTEVADIASITYTNADGNVVVLDTPAAIESFFTTGVTVEIVAGQTNAPAITFAVVDDVLYEQSEGFGVTISAPTNATLGTATASATIDDEDATTDTPANDKQGDKPVVSIAATDDVAVEGVDNAIVFTVSQTVVSAVDTTVLVKGTLGTTEVADIASITYTNADGNVVVLDTPAAIESFFTTGVTVEIVAGQTNAPAITFAVVDDVLYEQSEGFGVTISAPTNATLGTATASATIDDEDATTDTPANDKQGDKPVVSIAATDDVAVEGVDNAIVFTVSQTVVSAVDTTVLVKGTLGTTEVADIASITYTNADGNVVVLDTPAAIESFFTTGVTVEIVAGQTNAPAITFAVVDDVLYEQSEGFGVTISAPTNATLGTATASATIDDEDATTDTPANDKQGDKPSGIPSVSLNNTVKLDDDAILPGNAGGTNDQVDSEFVSGILGHDYGTDGPGSMVWSTIGAPIGFAYEASSSSLLIKQGAVTVLTLTLNTVTGAYTVIQNAPIDHTLGLAENNESFTVSYVVSDGDGSPADNVTGTLSIQVNDDSAIQVTNAVSVEFIDRNDNDLIASLGLKTGADILDSTISISQSLVGSTVTTVDGIVVKSDGVILKYTSDGSGGLNAVTNNVAQTVIFNITPTIAPDGTASYKVTLLGDIDPFVTDTFSLGGLANKLYDPSRGDYLQLSADDDATFTLRFEGYQDAVTNKGKDTLDNIINTATSTQKSTQGIGVNNNFIDNLDNTKTNDGAGESLHLKFNNSVRAIGLKLDQLDASDTAIWDAYTSAGVKVGHGEFLGNSIGGSNSADQIFFVNPGAMFNYIILSATEGSNYSLLTGGIVYVADETPLELAFDAVLTDGDGDSVNSSQFTVTLNPLDETQTNLLAAPISIDLNGDGIDYLARDAGITYDYNNDGIAESTAWVASEDGLLTLQKEDGTHNIVFSTQAGETDLQGLAKVYDSNKDGVLDASDTDFAKFGVWQDADSDGVVDSGEYLTLADRGITSLSLTSDGQVHFEANGDVIVYGQTTYTTADGELHIAEDVGFAVSDVYEPLDIAAIIANADAIESVTRIDQLTETDSSSSLMVELGGQTYEIATLMGQEVGTQDILSQFVGGDTSANLLTNKSWTDVIDIASDHGGPGAIIAAGGTLDNGSYANGEGDWTVIINSGDAKVDSTNNQITFASESAENSVTIVTADGSSHNIDNVDKIQWHG